MSNSGGENDFVTKESFNQVLQMMEEQKRMMEEQAQLNALMFKQMSDLMIQKPTKSKSKSKTQAPIRIIKTEKTASSSDDDGFLQRL
jgi:uncharacterized protein YecA (UPF0149 family)